MMLELGLSNVRMTAVGNGGRGYSGVVQLGKAWSAFVPAFGSFGATSAGKLNFWMNVTGGQRNSYSGLAGWLP